MASSSVMFSLNNLRSALISGFTLRYLPLHALASSSQAINSTFTGV